MFLRWPAAVRLYLDRESGKRLHIPVRGALAACPEVPGIRSLPGTSCIFDKCLWLRTYS